VSFETSPHTQVVRESRIESRTMLRECERVASSARANLPVAVNTCASARPAESAFDTDTIEAIIQSLIDALKEHCMVEQVVETIAGAIKSLSSNRTWHSRIDPLECTTCAVVRVKFTLACHTKLWL
jgi:hypothetical protein